jgi:hypothetical protein
LRRAGFRPQKPSSIQIDRAYGLAGRLGTNHRSKFRRSTASGCDQLQCNHAFGLFDLPIGDCLIGKYGHSSQRVCEERTWDHMIRRPAHLG